LPSRLPAASPDWRSVASVAVDAVSSEHSKRAYQKALKDFVARHSAELRPPFSRVVVQQYRSVLESAGLAPASIHLRLSAIRRLAAEAAENPLLHRGVAQGIVSLKDVRQSGNRAGNWLTREQARLSPPSTSKVPVYGPSAALGSAVTVNIAKSTDAAAELPQSVTSTADPLGFMHKAALLRKSLPLLHNQLHRCRMRQTRAGTRDR
jgi:hypothetical protein